MALYLLEITYTDKETTAIYKNFADELALSAEFDTKLGQAMKADSYFGEVLVAFDSTGKIIDSAFHYKDGVEAPISDYLVTVTRTAVEETYNRIKETDLNDLQGDAFVKRGAAKKNDSVLAILNLGVTSGAIVVNDYWARPVEEVEPQEEPEE